LKLSSICKKNVCRFPLGKILRSSSWPYANIFRLFHIPDIWCRLLFSKRLRVSCIGKNIDVVFHLQKYWGHLSFSRHWNRLPFSKRLMSSSIFQEI
jgi:hypothetical protein